MGNAFDSTNFPEKEPTVVVAGDRWMWKRTDLGSDYSPSLYTLSYSLRKDASTPTPEIEITATGSGTDFLVEIPSATSAAYTVGRYRWQAYITRDSDSERVAIGAGVLEIKSNYDEDATTDTRSHARKCLDSIEAAIEAFADDAVKSYSITTGSGSRSVTRKDWSELESMRAYYKAIVDKEERKQSGAGGAKLVFRL